MHFTTLSTISLMLTLAGAQTPSLADIKDQIPACATKPIMSSVLTSGCDLANIKCMCQAKGFQEQLEGQVMKDCTPQDQLKVLQFAQGFCGKVGVKISIPAQAKPGYNESELKQKAEAAAAAAKAAAAKKAAASAVIAKASAKKASYYSSSSSSAVAAKASPRYPSKSPTPTTTSEGPFPSASASGVSGGSGSSNTTETFTGGAAAARSSWTCGGLFVATVVLGWAVAVL